MSQAGAAWFGDRAVMVPLEDADHRAPVLRGLTAALPRLDVRAGIAAVLVTAREPDRRLLDHVLAALDAIDVDSPATSADCEQVTIPVQYDGADIAEVAGHLGCGIDTVISAHQEQLWSVAVMGFAAGFGYLVPEGEPTADWSALTRLPSPRDRVPAGSVAVAAGMSAVYPEAMPGGWRLLGRTAVRMFDETCDPAPSLLRPGMLVRFVRQPT